MAPTTDKPSAKDIPLPPAKMRWGGKSYKDDDSYRKSAERSAALLAGSCGLNADSRVLDIGCGQGRLLLGILRRLGRVARYVGLDVHEESIAWADRHLSDDEGTIRFARLDLRNQRYNPDGVAMPSDGFANALEEIGVETSFDVVALFSVFTHMHLDEMGAYLRAIGRVLSPRGRVFLSVFAEDGVEAEVENPDDYIREWTGPLHCVRVNRHLFEKLVLDAGLQVHEFRHRVSGEGVSTYVLTRREA